MLNTAIVTNQPIFPINFAAEGKPYKTDPFTLIDGRYVGHDGFVVPKDFDEFHQRFPHHISNWVKRHTDRLALREDLEDWTQDLIIHLKYLPLKSKHREVGKEDIVQTFDPAKHHGANQARFLNYINLCLANKFRTIHSKRRKDAMCHTGNLSLTAQVDAKNCGEVDDEYCHANSGEVFFSLCQLGVPLPKCGPFLSPVEQIIAKVYAEGPEVAGEERHIFLVAIACGCLDIGDILAFGRPHAGRSFLHFSPRFRDFRARFQS